MLRSAGVDHGRRWTRVQLEAAGTAYRHVSSETYSMDRPHSRSIPTAANRWVGTNEGALHNRASMPYWSVSPAPSVRSTRSRPTAAGAREMVDVHLMPLWWHMIPTVTANSVQGVRAVTIGGTLSSFEWDKIQ